MGRRKKKGGECVRDEELLIRNRPEHTHTHTHIVVTSWTKNAVLKSQRQSGMEGVGDLLFLFGRGRERGTWRERGKGLQTGFKVSKANECI